MSFTSEILKKKTQAQAFARKKGVNEHEAEDFASNCAILWLSKKRDIRTGFKYLLIDYLRLHGHVPGNRRGPDAALGATHATSPALLETIIHNQRNNDEPRRSFEFNPECLRLLSERERACIVLFYGWGFTNKEIGHCFGVGDSQISKIITGVRARLSSALREGTKEIEKIPSKTTEKMAPLLSLQTKRMEFRQNPKMALGTSCGLAANHAPGFQEGLI